VVEAFVAAVEEGEEVTITRVVELGVAVGEAEKLLEEEEEEEEEGVLYAVPVESWIVLVEVAEPCTAEEESEPERPVIWNG